MISEENADDLFTQTEQNSKQIFEQYRECALDENRWVYKCTECGFIGCYDGVYGDGCYMGNKDERACPKCKGTDRIRFGKIGRGSVEEWGLLRHRLNIPSITLD